MDHGLRGMAAPRCSCSEPSTVSCQSPTAITAASLAPTGVSVQAARNHLSSRVRLAPSPMRPLFMLVMSSSISFRSILMRASSPPFKSSSVSWFSRSSSALHEPCLPYALISFTGLTQPGSLATIMRPRPSMSRFTPALTYSAASGVVIQRTSPHTSMRTPNCRSIASAAGQLPSGLVWSPCS